MNETDIRAYAGLMAELDLTALEITQEDCKIRLERTPAAASVQNVVPVSVPAAAAAPAAEGRVIKSPVVGIFYASSAENAEPYVHVGSRVKKGDTLCIIEAMKLMNEITADEEGEITEICVGNGDAVEYGTVLFRIGR